MPCTTADIEHMKTVQYSVLDWRYGFDCANAWAQSDTAITEQNENEKVTHDFAAQDVLFLLRQLSQTLEVCAVLSDKRSLVEEVAALGEPDAFAPLVDIAEELVLRFATVRLSACQPGYWPRSATNNVHERVGHERVYALLLFERILGCRADDGAARMRHRPRNLLVHAVSDSRLGEGSKQGSTLFDESSGARYAEALGTS